MSCAVLTMMCFTVLRCAMMGRSCSVPTMTCAVLTILCNAVQGMHTGGHIIRLGALCEVCGDPAGLSAGEGLCFCSGGHSVCRLCLRQYVLWTHGLQVGLEDSLAVVLRV